MAAVSSSAPLPRSSTTSAPWPWASAASAAGSGASVKPGLAEVRRVDAQDDRGAAIGERRLEVRRARPVRRPDLDQARAGPPDDLGDPDAATDLDELAAATATPPPRPARPTASASAAALLLVTSASSAPVRAIRCSSAARNRGAAPTGRRGRARAGGSRRPPRRPPRSPRPATAPARGSCGGSRPSR